MIPLLFGTVGIFIVSVEAVGFGATAGMSYGIGRKYGRRFCEIIDNAEGRITGLFTQIGE